MRPTLQTTHPQQGPPVCASRGTAGCAWPVRTWTENRLGHAPGNWPQPVTSVVTARGTAGWLQASGSRRGQPSSPLHCHSDLQVRTPRPDTKALYGRQVAGGGCAAPLDRPRPVSLVAGVCPAPSQDRLGVSRVPGLPGVGLRCGQPTAGSLPP